MRLTSFLRFSVTQTLERKRSKIKAGRTNFSVVFAKSTVSGAKVQRIRSKDEDKLEFMWWDPQVQKEVLFVEDSKVRTVPESPLKKYWPEFLPTRHENVTTLRAESPTCYHPLPRTYWMTEEWKKNYVEERKEKLAKKEQKSDKKKKSKKE